MTVATLVNENDLVQHLDDPSWISVDCRFMLSDPSAGPEMYRTSHIPNARYADLDKDMSSSPTEHTGRHPLPSLADWTRKLSDWGINKESTVVAYDQLGGPLAARFWWLLRWAGHQHVMVLNGGFPAWERAGNPVTAELPVLETAEYSSDVRHDLWVSTADVEEFLERDAPGQVLVDARAAPRFCGETEPIDPIAGHVPTAINRPFAENLDEEGLFRPPAELRERFADLADDPRDVVHMCGSGVTACHNLLAMESAGLSGSKLYLGSWSEWIQQPNRPIATGSDG
jgi:thiosulfate/3-mercaptopyruvate sulfurtransferase